MALSRSIRDFFHSESTQGPAPETASEDFAGARVSCRVPSECEPHRRGLLMGALGAGLVIAAGLIAPDEALAALGGTRRIKLHNVNTTESFDGVYWRDGAYVPEALQTLNVVLRDHRAEEVTVMDPGVFDYLLSLQSRLGFSGPIDIISAYRSPKTNAARAKVNKAVARNSFHMKGMALDIRMAGRQPKGVYSVAVAMQRGGAGIYRRSGFVHIDSGPVRHW